MSEVNAAWLADVLSKLVHGWLEATLDDLLPWAAAYSIGVSEGQDQKQAA